MLSRSTFSLDQQCTAESVKDRAKEQTHEETLETTAAGTTQKHRP